MRVRTPSKSSRMERDVVEGPRGWSHPILRHVQVNDGTTLVVKPIARKREAGPIAGTQTDKIPVELYRPFRVSPF